MFLNCYYVKYIVTIFYLPSVGVLLKNLDHGRSKFLRSFNSFKRIITINYIFITLGEIR